MREHSKKKQPLAAYGARQILVKPQLVVSHFWLIAQKSNPFSKQPMAMLD